MASRPTTTNLRQEARSLGIPRYSVLSRSALQKALKEATTKKETAPFVLDEWVKQCLSGAQWTFPLVDALFKGNVSAVAEAVKQLPTATPCDGRNPDCLQVYANSALTSPPLWTFRLKKKLGEGVSGETVLVGAIDTEGKEVASLVIKRLKASEQYIDFLTELIIAGLVGCTNPQATPKLISPLVLYFPLEKTQFYGAVFEPMTDTLRSVLGRAEFTETATYWVSFILQVWRIFLNLQHVLQFEHRDLHSSNIMYNPTTTKTLRLAPCLETKKERKKETDTRYGLDCVEEDAINLEFPTGGLEWRIIDTGYSALVVPGTTLRLAAGAFKDVTLPIGLFGDLPYFALGVLWGNFLPGPVYGRPADPINRIPPEIAMFFVHLVDGLWLPWGDESATGSVSVQERRWLRISARQLVYPTQTLGKPAYGLRKISEYVRAREQKGEPLSFEELQVLFPIGRYPPPVFKDEASAYAFSANLYRTVFSSALPQQPTQTTTSHPIAADADTPINRGRLSAAETLRMEQLLDSPNF